MFDVIEVRIGVRGAGKDQAAGCEVGREGSGKEGIGEGWKGSVNGVVERVPWVTSGERPRDA